jgi:CheY-like chemotaxis protein
MTGRALLVDDEALVRESIADMLGELGFAVTEASSASQALAFLRQSEAVDVVITDHLMPHMTGVELGRAIGREWPGLPVLLVSGYSDDHGPTRRCPGWKSPSVRPIWPRGWRACCPCCPRRAEARSARRCGTA